MNTVLVNYATPDFTGYRAVNALTGLRAGCDRCLAFHPGDLDSNFIREHAAILGVTRGAGYYLWKPYIVVQALSRIDNGDVLFYCDAGIHFVNPIAPVLRLLERTGRDLLVLDGGFVESQYTKRDTFLLMDCDSPRYADSAQSFGGAFLIRKSPWSIRFAAKWLKYACDPRLLTDRPNELGVENYPNFIAHRHDQSILSLLAKREGIEFEPNRYIVQGALRRDGQVLNVTRKAMSLDRIAIYLLAEGVLGISDIKVLSRDIPCIAALLPTAPPRPRRKRVADKNADS